MDLRTAFAFATALVGAWMAFSGAVAGLMTLVIFFTTPHNPIVTPGFSGIFSVVSPLIPTLSGAFLLFFNRSVVDLILKLTGLNGEALFPKFELRPFSIVSTMALGLYLVGTEVGKTAWVFLSILVNAMAPQTMPAGQIIRLPEVIADTSGLVLGLYLALNPHRVTDFILRRVEASDRSATSSE